VICFPSTFIASVNVLYPQCAGQLLSLEEILHTGNCTLLGYEAASSGSFLPTFRDNLSVPSSGFKNPFVFLLDCSLLSYYSESSGNFLQTFRDNLSVPSSGFKNPFVFLLDCSLLGYYSESSGNFLPTFRDNLSVPSSGETY
jgi:hypothetical protein